MHRWIAVALAGVFVLGLMVGCGEEAPTPTPKPKTGTTKVDTAKEAPAKTATTTEPAKAREPIPPAEQAKQGKHTWRVRLASKVVAFRNGPQVTYIAHPGYAHLVINGQAPWWNSDKALFYTVIDPQRTWSTTFAPSGRFDLPDALRASSLGGDHGKAKLDWAFARPSSLPGIHDCTWVFVIQETLRPTQLLFKDKTYRLPGAPTKAPEVDLVKELQITQLSGETEEANEPRPPK